jgi:hypothetical protein
MKRAGELLCLALAAAPQLQLPETVIIGQFLDRPGSTVLSVSRDLGEFDRAAPAR